MKKRPLLVISGTVIGTIGVLSYVPVATNALAPLSVSSPTLATSAQASAPFAATSSKTSTTKAVNKTTKKQATQGTSATRKISGSTIQTPFGPVQVQITVRGKKIIGARALQTPQGGRSSQINQQAVPYLIQETLAAQSANIQGVSGASYTSDGWAQSLQSAVSKI